MSAKIILVFCAQALFIQSALSQYFNRHGLAAAPGFAPYGLGLDFTPTNGGGLPVSSASNPRIPISVTSENYYEGPLNVIGELPFIGTVGLEGVLPTAGAGVVNHACGNGINAMVSEDVAFAPAGLLAPGLAAPLVPGLAGPLAPGLALPFGPGLAAPGLGYRGYRDYGYAL